MRPFPVCMTRQGIQYTQRQSKYLQIGTAKGLLFQLSKLRRVCEICIRKRTTIDDRYQIWFAPTRFTKKLLGKSTFADFASFIFTFSLVFFIQVGYKKPYIQHSHELDSKYTYKINTPYFIKKLFISVYYRYA